MIQIAAHLQAGLQAEKAARHFLKQQGLRLITHNYRCKYGEIDLIMKEKDTLVFVEVRFRNDQGHGNSMETIGYSKQNKLIKTALSYLQTQQMLYCKKSRFDVIGIDAQQTIQWIKNAFEVEY